jgi:hypothetical protein
VKLRSVLERLEESTGSGRHDWMREGRLKYGACAMRLFWRIRTTGRRCHGANLDLSANYLEAAINANHIVRKGLQQK